LALENAARLAKDKIISVVRNKVTNVEDNAYLNKSVNPGHLKSDLNRHARTGASKYLSFLLYPPYYGAITELAAGFSPKVSFANNGAYLIPWGRIGKLNSSVGQGWAERGSGTRLWDVLEKEVETFL
jgi:hypothetical protein